MTDTSALRRISRRWSALGSAARRRIVFGVLLAAGLAAWDFVLLLVTGALFALTELAPRPTGRATASS